MSSIESFVKKYNNEAVELLEILGKIPAPSHKEDKRAEFCKNWFVSQGFNDVLIDKAKNVLCKINFDKFKDIVVLMAHTDVVFEDVEELPMKKLGNKLYAPGIGDDTANLVNLMIASKMLIENSLNTNKAILIVANSCEEGLGNLKGSKEIFKNYGDRITEFYSFDGYLGGITNAPVGSYRYKITVRAEGGHSYGDFGRENAIHIAAKLIDELYKIEVPAQDKTTFNVGKICGGSTVNSIAEETVFLYEYRSPSQDCLSTMEKSFSAVIDNFKAQGKKIEVEVLGIRPGMGNVDKDKLIAFTNANVEIHKKYWSGDVVTEAQSTDANIPLSQGIIANTIGTVMGDGAHTREEWVDLNSLPIGISIVSEIIKEFIY